MGASNTHGFKPSIAQKGNIAMQHHLSMFLKYNEKYFVVLHDAGWPLGR
jgi:hypothetical protein